MTLLHINIFYYIIMLEHTDITQAFALVIISQPFFDNIILLELLLL